MILKGKSKFKKIKESFWLISKLAAGHLFFACLFLIFVSLFLGLITFYKYNVLPQRIEPELGEVIKFKEGIFQKILKQWQDRGERFEAAKTKQYPDLFK